MKNIHFTLPDLINASERISVAVIGVGGTGSHVLTNLARINHTLIEIGKPGLHVTAYDPDTVSEANIGRQSFTRAEIGQFKSEVLISKINRAYGFDWNCTTTKFKVTDPENYFFYITCVDTVKARKSIAAAFKRMSNKSSTTFNQLRVPTYWMDFGNDTDDGQVFLGTITPVKQPENSKFKCHSHLPTLTDEVNLDILPEDNDSPSCSVREAILKQDLFVNSTLAQLGCNLFWKLLKDGFIVHRGCFMNLNSMRINPIKL